MLQAISNKNNLIKIIADRLFQTKSKFSSYQFEQQIVLKEKFKISKNNELNESIIYAKRIQEGMMLKEKHLLRLFPKSFINFKPKDIVSGDFYWFTQINNKIIIAVADCTGPARRTARHAGTGYF